MMSFNAIDLGQGIAIVHYPHHQMMLSGIWQDERRAEYKPNAYLYAAIGTQRDPFVN